METIFLTTTDKVSSHTALGYNDKEKNLSTSLVLRSSQTPPIRCVEVTNNEHQIPIILSHIDRVKRFNYNYNNSNNKTKHNSNLIEIRPNTEDHVKPKTKTSLDITYQNVSGIRSRTNVFYENIIAQDQDIIAITES